MLPEQEGSQSSRAEEVLDERAPAAFRTDRLEAPQVGPRRYRVSRRVWVIAGVLFCLTGFSTFLTGQLFGEPSPGKEFWDHAWDGFLYAGPLMLILTCHEMGHYLVSRAYGVPASPPFFIPLPPGFGVFGTMGAVIFQMPGIAHRRAMFDIAIAGPLAGFVVAVPIAWLGIQQSRVAEFSPDQFALSFGDPLILKAMARWSFGEMPPNSDLVLNPLLYAGWVGIFLTGLNLFPVGQLDGGHITYALLGKRAHTVSLAAVFISVLLMAYTNNWAYSVMVVLMAMVGLSHPPTADDTMPLGLGRIVLGWMTLGLLILCFTPIPLQFHEPPPAANPGLPKGEPPAEFPQEKVTCRMSPFLGVPG